MNKLLLKITLSCMTMLFWSIGLYAQTNRTISGTVKDETGTPLPSVSIVVKNSKAATSTNAEGKYAIQAAEGNTIQFSYIGYIIKEVVVGSGSTINVNMEPDSKALQEVTVEGALGIKKLDKNLGYAATKISGDEITRTNTVNPIAALQGKVAGVNVNV